MEILTRGLNFHIPHRYNMKDYFSHITNIKCYRFQKYYFNCGYWNNTHKILYVVSIPGLSAVRAECPSDMLTQLIACTSVFAESMQTPGEGNGSPLSQVKWLCEWVQGLLFNVSRITWSYSIRVRLSVLPSVLCLTFVPMAAIWLWLNGCASETYKDFYLMSLVSHGAIVFGSVCLSFRPSSVSLLCQWQPSESG
jgi:hypothetical protein